MEILKCSECGIYTLKDKCPICNNKCLSPKPAKFSIDDKFGKYRRIYKKTKA